MRTCTKVKVTSLSEDGSVATFELLSVSIVSDDHEAQLPPNPSPGVGDVLHIVGGELESAS